MTSQTPAMGNAPVLSAEDQKRVQEAAATRPAMGRSQQPNYQAPAVPDQTPDDVQAALKSAIRQYEIETDYVRRHHVRRARKAVEFWRGNQNLIFSNNGFNWHDPFQRALDDLAKDDLPRDYRVYNLYLAWGLSVIATLIQSPGKIAFRPESTAREEDITTAKAADKVWELIKRNNRYERDLAQCGYLMWTQGMLGAYVRFVVDGNRWGQHDELVWEDGEVELLPERLECQNCDGFQRMSNLGSMLPDTPACPRCGQPLGPESYRPAETMAAPMATGSRKVPNGAELISYYSALNLKLPPFARDQNEAHYLILEEEQHGALLRSAYPDKADQIGATDTGTAEDTYERIARLSVLDSAPNRGTMPFAQLITYKRCWLRPDAYYAHFNSEMRTKLLELYPDGVRVEMAGNVFLRAENERMDDHWEITPSMPGEGIYRQGMGDATIPVQEQINDRKNIEDDHASMASAPPILYDSRYIDGDALSKRRMMPGAYTAVAMRAAPNTVPLEAMLFQPKFQMDQMVTAGAEERQQLGEFLGMALPAIFGGGMKHNETATGYGQARDQALGRISLVWKVFREFQAYVATKAVKCFQKNRTGTVELVMQGGGAEFKSEFIDADSLQGSAVAFASSEEEYPSTWGGARDALGMMLKSGDQGLLSIIGNPVNLPVVLRYAGVPDLRDPDEDNRSKQALETARLLQGQPQAVVDQMGERMMSTIQPDLYADKHGVHIQTIQAWAVSPEGIAAKASNPGGYANNIAHLVEHLDAEKRLAAILAAQQPPAPGGPAAEPPPAAPPENQPSPQGA